MIGRRWQAKSDIGAYQVYQKIVVNGRTISPRWISPEGKHAPISGTEDEAKTGAQADFERRTRQAAICSRRGHGVGA
jgi:hypothetical protein